MAKKEKGTVLVVGGGVGGVQVSLDLADQGLFVYLVEKSPSIGGVMGQLDKTFPTNDCSMCILSPKLVDVGRHPNIELITNAVAEAIEGSPGDFQVAIRKKARYVTDACVGCGLCAEACVLKGKFPNEFDEGKGTRAAVYIPFPQAVPLKYIVDEKNCLLLKYGKCSQKCIEACAAKAIDFEQKDEVVKLNVGAVVLTPGFDEYEPEQLAEFGYGRFQNVVSSIEYERIMCASGPSQGHIIRPSDGEEPGKVAWIQCIGSRSPKIDHGYCSSVCCMYATKEAVITKEHSEKLKPTIFYMDMRSYGKDFDKYITRAEKELGIRFVRTRISSISEDERTKSLDLTYENGEGKLVTERFDMVVLSVGLDAPKSNAELSQAFGIELNRYGFAKTDEFSPIASTKEGIFVGGAFTGPKDIPETVAQSSGIASQVASILKDVRWTETRQKEYVAEIDVSSELPRIGVFICHCGINIGAYVNVPEVVKYAQTLPSVAYAEENLYTCSADTQERIKEKIKEHKLNRVIVAACTPRTHEPLFRGTIKEAGLNKYLFEMANIREHDSWVHMGEKNEATEQAKDLLRMAVEKSCRLESLEERKVPVTKSALVIGGGISGMSAALSLSKGGFPVTLLERNDSLGGETRHIAHLLSGTNVQEKLKETIDAVKGNKDIEVVLSCSIKEIKGYVGNFETTVSSIDGEKEIKHGIIVVATGTKEYEPKEFLYGKSEKVITQRKFEELLEQDSSLSSTNAIVMIQCVGSRNDENPWCSRVCCTSAVKNAIAFKDKFPERDVYVLYRDIRTYGFKEDYYQSAREKGVVFIHFEEEQPPLVDEKNGAIEVTVMDPVLRNKLLLPCDLLVLSAGLVPREGREELAKMLKVPLNQDGFFLEAHMKLRPVDFASDGIFLCGTCHSPKFIDESIAQASAAASRAMTVLSRDQIEAGGAVAFVDEEMCRGCGDCVKACEYSAIEIIERDVSGVEGWSEPTIKVAQVNGVVCKGCGACSVACPSGAITARHFTTEQLESMIKAATVKI